VKLYRADAASGKQVRLRFAVTDNSGRAEEAFTILRGPTPIASFTVPMHLVGIVPGITASRAWRTPLGSGSLTACLTATDASGNRSAPSCTQLRIP
jgi:hypothetical protein